MMHRINVAQYFARDAQYCRTGCVVAKTEPDLTGSVRLFLTSSFEIAMKQAFDKVDCDGLKPTHCGLSEKVIAVIHVLAGYARDVNLPGASYSLSVCVFRSVHIVRGATISVDVTLAPRHVWCNEGSSRHTHK
jgi:hypothetical protein